MSSRTNPTVRWWRRVSWLSQVGVVASCCGCTLLTEFDVEQCSLDADCDLVDGVARHCADRRCVPGCTSNAACIALDPRTPICREEGGQCVSLATEEGECYSSTDFVEASMADRTAAEMVLLGSFQPELEPSARLTMELAVNELNGEGGIPVDGEDRPLMLIICNDAPQALPVAMQHLVQDLGVRGVVAPAGTQALRDAMTLPATNGDAFFLSPTDSYAPPDDFEASARLLWYLGADYRSTIPAYTQLFQQLEANRAPAGLRVAVLVGEQVEDTRLADAVRASLVLDGMGENELVAHDRLRSYDLTKLMREPDQLLDLGKYAPQLLVFFVSPDAPDTDTPVLSEFLDQLNARDGSAVWTPLYLFGPRNAEDALLSNRAVMDPAFADRALGIRAYRTAPATALASLQARFQSAFPLASVGPTPELYDALYLLAYSVGAAPYALQGSESVFQGFERVTEADGEPVPVGPGDAGLTRVRQLLEEDASFQLLGTTGGVDFDSVRHVRPSAVQIYCWDGGEVLELANYGESTQTFVTGSPGCARGVL